MSDLFSYNPPTPTSADPQADQTDKPKAAEKSAQMSATTPRAATPAAAPDSASTASKSPQKANSAQKIDSAPTYSQAASTPDSPPTRGDNTPTFSVSDLSGALKRTIEGAFGQVRVRGELSRVTVAKSGHMYSSLKDDKSVIDAICWRGSMQKLSIKPEEGMEVICTGRLTTYPGRSSYQIIIESMELAGEGALLKMLEERKKKLAGEGLFDDSRKQLLPYLPAHIGIITSPTGAVIRDILHRISERFPMRVTLWPVMVQGQGAAQQVTQAVRGFNNLPQGFAKPDLLIVARGGGSLEDLMPFNEENVVRAVADSIIPIISAVGHETDVTLCDFAADKRAPTPTGAAEMAVPVRSDLIATVHDLSQRARRRIFDLAQRKKDRLAEHSNALERFPRTLEQTQQRLDYAATSLPSLFKGYVSLQENRLNKVSAHLTPPAQQLHKMQMRLSQLDPSMAYKTALQSHATTLTHSAARLAKPDNVVRQKSKDLHKAFDDLNRRSLMRLDTQRDKLARANDDLQRKKDTLTTAHAEKLNSFTRLLDTLSFKNVLARGYSVVRDGQSGTLISSAKLAKNAKTLNIEFGDGEISAAPNSKPTLSDT